ncbi:MAG: DNA-3-methyladenine glycosylase, partial [Armatimonadetes bacterium]|nr:DNA-3-methyladenine glycosylase [Armatimonadota bacterium]
GKLCQALGVTLEHNGLAVTRPPLCITAPPVRAVTDRDVVQTTRVGLRHDRGADLLLRFYLGHSPLISRR